MNDTVAIKKFKGLQTSPWIVVGAALILLVIVIVFAMRNIGREAVYMSSLLRENGAARIKSFEAGIRAGMRRMMRDEDHVQHLLEEIARQSDVLYMLVVDENGVVLAHNQTEFIGQTYVNPGTLSAVRSGGDADWRLIDTGKGKRSFEVYREFRPFDMPETMRRYMESGRERQGRMPRTMMDWEAKRFTASSAEKGRRYVFIGLDVSPFENARASDIRNTVVISAVLLLSGFAGFLSLFWLQNYRSARRSLQDSTALTDEVVSNLPVGLIATDQEGRIAFFNTAAERITGISQHDAFGKDPMDILPNHWGGFKEQLDRGRSITEQETVCSFSYQKDVPISVSAARIVNEDGGFVGNVLILRDLREVRQLQEEIRRKEKLAALGGLAAGVAHEIRNPLSSIKGIATYFGGKFSKDSGDKETAEVMIREVDRLNRVISELLEFARPTDLKHQPTDIYDLLVHALQLVRQDAKIRNISIDLPERAGDMRLLIDPDRFAQCLLNLFLNAIQAMADGGRLSIRLIRHDDDWVDIEISDTGRGIPAESLHRIFDPYYTTKTTGTGLGLAIVHKIIEAHHGRIRVESMPGKGTTFTITLPRAAA
jgi:two-component system sensor histidine kinase HydH